MSVRFKPYPVYKHSGVESLGDIPERWDAIPIGRLGRLTKGHGGSKEDEVPEGIPCIRYGDLYTRHRYFIESARSFISAESAHEYSPIRYGDVLFAGSGETMADIGKSAATLLDYAVCGGDIIIFRPAGRFDTRFLGYAAGSQAAIDQKAQMGRGFTVVHVYGDELKSLRLPVPPHEEQGRIAGFLDRETARIDGLVAKKERLIELLREKRTALITRAVTKGLDPNVPMKDSGVEWLGEIPAHWEVNRTKFAATLRSGHTPSRQRPEYWLDCTIPWFGLADVWQIRDGQVEYVFETTEKISELGLANSAARLLPKGTVILSRTASVGFSAILGVPMATTQDFVNWVCGPALRPEYLLYVFRSMGYEFRRLTMGSTHQTIYMPDVGGFVTPIPSLIEQDQIVAVIRKETSRIDALVAKVREAIERLKEFQTALISAAVTGKIDVRGEIA